MKAIRAKGAAFEREVASFFNSALSLQSRRTSITTAFLGGGNHDLSGLPSLAPECKRVDSLNFRAAMAQAIRNAGASIPVVFTRRNREALPDGLAVLRVSDFLTLYRSHLAHTGQLPTTSSSVLDRAAALPEEGADASAAPSCLRNHAEHSEDHRLCGGPRHIGRRQSGAGALYAQWAARLARYGHRPGGQL
jgi:hypothetical protein